MNGVRSGTSTSSVTSSSGRARSMKAWRLERNTRKRWSKRMSTEAGCTHFGSNGSIPMRPAEIAARMSRSDRTTGAEYGPLAPREPEHEVAQRGPCSDRVIRVGDRRSRESPEHLDGPGAGGAAHREVGRAVADDDGLVGRDVQTSHGVPREIRRGLWSC